MVARPLGSGIARALDEARFGPARTLDLRAGRPSVAEAVRRAEPWLRERQMACAGDVLIVTGRGAGSPGGVGAIRQAMQTLLVRLKRVGVVERTVEHNPGAFAVKLAPIRALFETALRSRHRELKQAEIVDPAGLAALESETRSDLRRLAERSLFQLGVPVTPSFVEDEMLRQFSVLVSGIDPAETDRAARLKFMVAAACAAYEDD